MNQNMQARRRLGWCLVSLVAAGAVLVAWWPGQDADLREQYVQIQDGMTQHEVAGVLGAPWPDEDLSAPAVGGACAWTTGTWQTAEGTIQVYFDAHGHVCGKSLETAGERLQAGRLPPSGTACVPGTGQPDLPSGGPDHHPDGHDGV